MGVNISSFIIERICRAVDRFVSGVMINWPREAYLARIMAFILLCLTKFVTINGMLLNNWYWKNINQKRCGFGGNHQYRNQEFFICNTTEQMKK